MNKQPCLKRLAAICAIAAAGAAFGAAPFVIAQRGKPATCVIVLPAAPSEAESYAAQELQNFTKRMTGVDLLVASAPVDGKNAVVLSKTRKDPHTA